ncbi:HNH endonuclease signature motif containing protein, partial [Bradyrhizobium sp. GCM10027634]|uniref:HNH endonuclease signature motif containing protein n=1 Tax=unclassified Bradyrhizobium TaxID=2631580 RepID=UPI00263A429D
MKAKTETLEIDLQELRRRLDYDPASGVFRRRGKGKPISLKPNGTGYLRVSYDGVSFKAHRLAWFYVYGEWPSGDLDHANGVKTDNRIANLRPATRPQNQQNHPLTRKNSVGFKGVSLHTLSRPDRPRYV